MSIGRRTVLAAGGIAAVGVVGGAAGCSSPAAVDGGQDGGTGTGGTAGDVLATTADIPVGGGVVLADRKIVLTQPAEGDIRAFTAVCPHQGCLVAEVADGAIICPCHASVFSAEDGSVVSGPALEPLAAASVAIEGTDVVLA